MNEFQDRGIVSQRRQQAGGGGTRRVQGASLAEMGDIAGVMEKQKPEGRELVVEGRETGEQRAK